MLGCLFLGVHVWCAYSKVQGSQLVELHAGWGRGRGRDASSLIAFWECIQAGTGQPVDGGAGRLGQGQSQGCLLLGVHVGCAFRQAKGSLMVDVQKGWGRGRGREASSFVCMW
jgi:hypothetical protein